MAQTDSPRTTSFRIENSFVLVCLGSWRGHRGKAMAVLSPGPSLHAGGLAGWRRRSASRSRHEVSLNAERAGQNALSRRVEPSGRNGAVRRNGDGAGERRVDVVVEKVDTDIEARRRRP